MRRKSETTRQRIIDAAYEQIWRTGFNRTSLDTIAERANVTKRTLYCYFRSKDELLQSVLSHYNDLAAQRLKRIGDRMPPDRDGLIASFFGQLAGWADAVPRWSGSGFTRLVVELADLPGHPARSLARKAKSATESWLAEKLVAVGVDDAKERATEMMLLLEGSLALTLIHGQRRYFEVAARAASRLMAPAAAAKVSARKRKEKTGPRGERPG